MIVQPCLFFVKKCKSLKQKKQNKKQTHKQKNHKRNQKQKTKQNKRKLPQNPYNSMDILFYNF